MSGPTSLVPMAFVRSVPGSIAFYGLLGFSVGDTYTPPAQEEPSWAWLRSGGAHLMVTKASHPVDPEQQAVLFCLYSDDLPAFHARLEVAGLAVGEITFPFDCPRGEFRLKDPDG